MNHIDLRVLAPALTALLAWLVPSPKQAGALLRQGLARVADLYITGAPEADLVTALIAGLKSAAWWLPLVLGKEIQEVVHLLCVAREKWIAMPPPAPAAAETGGGS